MSPTRYLSRPGAHSPGESQKAFNLLSKRLKPLEHYQPIPYDFYNLAYLTSAGTVHDAPGLKDWSGEALEREKLVGTWREMMKSTDTDSTSTEQGHGRGRRNVKPGRLVELLKQAGAWQVQRARRRGSGPWTFDR
jgi:COMPASS component SWD3